MASSHLPKSRLNQIARRKLGQLGVPSALSRDGEVLEVELISLQGRVRNPLNQEPIPRARFRVFEHDRAQFLEPPILASMAPFGFYDFKDLTELLIALDKALGKHYAAMRATVGRLQARGAAAEIDPDLGKIVVRVSLPSALGTAIVIGGPESLTPARLERGAASSGFAEPSTAAEVLPLEGPPLGAEALATLSALEEALMPLAQAAVAARAAAPKPAEPKAPAYRDSGDIILKLSTTDLPSAQKEPTPPPAISRTVASAKMPSHLAHEPRTTDTAPPSPPRRPIAVASLPGSEERPVEPTPARGGGVHELRLRELLEKFGDEAVLRGGFRMSSPIDLSGQPLAFQVEHTPSGVLHARILSTDAGALWEGPVELAEFPGVETFVRRALGFPDEPRPAGRSAAAPLPRRPNPGEVWSMRVLIEAESEEEIRYVNLNAKGQPYGAARVLPRSVFDAAFEEDEGGHRMQVQIAEVDSETVTYVRLDPGGELGGHPPKTVPLPAFVAQFALQQGREKRSRPVTRGS